MADKRRLDDEAWNEDLSHATPAGRAVAGSDRPRLEAKGIGVDELKACESEGRDGTRLAGCVKSYRPQPDGRWGLVLRLVRFEGELGLLLRRVRGAPSRARLAAERLPGRPPPPAPPRRLTLTEHRSAP